MEVGTHFPSTEETALGHSNVNHIAIFCSTGTATNFKNFPHRAG